MGESAALAATLVAVGFIYWSPLRRIQTALGIGHLVSTGHAFLVLGCLLAFGIGKSSKEVVEQFGPVASFLAGWIGFAIGMRFDLRILRTVPARAFLVALAPPVAAAGIVGGAGFGCLALLGAPSTQAWAASCVLAAAAATSGPTLVATLRRRRAGRSADARPVLRMIEFSASVDDVVTMGIAVTGFACFRPIAEPIHGFGWMAITVGAGALLGGVTWLFLGGRAKEDERLLLGLAMLAFIAGFAGWLHLSPVGVAGLAALVVTNLPNRRGEQLSLVVRRVERPAVIALMTAIGFESVGELGLVVLPLILVVTVVRLLAKQLGGAIASKPIPGAPGISPRRGWASGLAAQGTLGLVVALSFFHIWRDELARSVLAAIAIASLLNELGAPWLLLRLVRRTTAVGPRLSIPPRGIP
ncbi:MAG: hypothetical protein JW751_24795 [Polyangiaceae bacterium]|nr:hypothetical protein [Polyangiaceae bacterium]